MGGKFIVNSEEFARLEEVTGEYGGQFASFEWVWSPRGEDGRTMKMFNCESGDLNQEVLKYWRNYDIRLILEKNWPRLAPKLKGKINVICGDADTFRLDEAVKILCGFFKEKGSYAVCELVPGRDHGDLYQPYQTYPDGLAACQSSSHPGGLNLFIFLPFSENGAHPCAFILISIFEAYDYGDDTNYLATCPTRPSAQAQ